MVFLVCCGRRDWHVLCVFVLVGLASSSPLNKKRFGKIQEIENRKTCFVRGCCSKEEQTLVAWLVGVTDLDARMQSCIRI